VPVPAFARRELRRAVESTALMLRNTPAVCRKSYIHPAVIESFASGRLQHAMRGRTEEAALIHLLQHRGNGTALQARRLRIGRAPYGTSFATRQAQSFLLNHRSTS